MRRRIFLIVLLIFMLVVLAVLAGLFVVLRSAAEAPPAVQSPGLKTIRSIYGWGKNPDELLQEPFSIVWRNGSLFVGDKAVSQVIQLTPEGGLVAKYGTKGRGPEEVWSVSGLEVDEQGNVYIADGGHEKVVVYGPDGSFVRQAAIEGSPLALLLSGNLMYATTNSSVKVLQMPEMNELRSWGSRGKGTEQFDYPNGLALDVQTSVLYVADGNNHRAKALDQQGNVLWIYGTPPESMNDSKVLFGLAGTAAFADGYLFVTDPLDSVVHILDAEGTKVAQVGDVGQADGLFYYPAGITHMGGKRFAIAEWGNSRIQIVEIDVPAAIEEWQRTRPADSGAVTPSTEASSLPAPEGGTTSTSE
ncbi:MAG: 6-bladed beta-propeller [Actinobacteria bacterium]|nr:6-bladed beta-propeller [Actinomycetota bacterium]